MRSSRAFLTAIAVSTGSVLLLFLAWPPITFDEDGIPLDRPALALRLANRPADWLTIVRVTESALDWPVTGRLPLWREAHTLARRYAPMRDNADVAYVKNALFHWNDLTEDDRRGVIDASVRLIRDPRHFERLHRALFDLTRDIGALRRGNPGTIWSTSAIAQLAVTNGRFDDYRALRDQLVKLHAADMAAANRPLDVIGVTNTLQWTTREDAVIVQALEKLATEPPEEDRPGADAVERLATYTLAHGLGPLDGLVYYAKAESYLRDPLRARLAWAAADAGLATQVVASSAGSDSKEWAVYHSERAIGAAAAGNIREADSELRQAMAAGDSPKTLVACARVAGAAGRDDMRQQCLALLEEQYGGAPKWTNLYGTDLIGTASATVWASTPRTVTFDLVPVQTDEVPPYVEAYRDDAPAGEGEVATRRTFSIPLSPGLHTLSLRLLNPHTRNGVSRRVGFGQ
jgi:hypothetical protein